MTPLALQEFQHADLGPFPAYCIEQPADCRILCRNAQQLVPDVGKQLPLLPEVEGNLLGLTHDIVHLHWRPRPLAVQCMASQDLCCCHGS